MLGCMRWSLKGLLAKKLKLCIKMKQFPVRLRKKSKVVLGRRRKGKKYRKGY